jgi:hypothetical protein
MRMTHALHRTNVAIACNLIPNAARIAHRVAIVAPAM